MKKIILGIAVVAFIAIGTISVNAQDPQKVEVKKATTEVATKTAETKECAAAGTKACDTAKKSCCETAKACDTKALKTTKAKKEKK